MKHITLLAIAAAFTLPMQGQVIFESGFEDWTGNTPDGWLGVRTSVGFSDSVSQVSTNPHSGSFSVRLQNRLLPTGDHRRFTTQPLTVDSGVTYTVSFWARGFGDVRLGVFDGRPGNGYSPYTGYITVANGENWQQYELTRTVVVSTSEAEFILSVKGTLAPDHLIIDDVNISGGGSGPSITSINAIQFTTDPGGASPLAGQTVNTGGIVTANASNGFFIQNGGGPWSGIFVFSTQNVPARGDSVTFSASVTEFFGMTQLQNVNDFIVVSQGNAEVVSTITAVQANTEDYEGVLIRVNAATCINPDIGNNQWSMNDGTATLSVDELLYTFTPTQGAVYNVTGPTRYSFDSYRVMPRDANDIEVVTNVDELAFASVMLYPNPTSDLLTIELGTLDSRVAYFLTDALGRTVRTGSVMAARTNIEIADLHAGLYHITLRTDNAARSLPIYVIR
ncbi:MAG: carbohydrate binding domain-containing protein [Flavobacteriales bacterium]|nr:carbohydrate binding domain-containing protein [Flavobacteriales bacterium]